jgi:arabinofuranan 3-O-arabinosyltransferase
VRVFAACLALVTLAFLQDPGRVSADTKLDLTINPWGFLGRSLHLWDPEGFFGQLQNQAYGYLWPMGPFFGVGHTLGLPAWVVQRLWWSLILVSAFLGMYLLLKALGVGGRWPQIIAGLAYALAVRPQSALAAISVEVWPMALAPWVLLPLVRGAQRGNVARAAALSALAVVFAGGVNAVAVGAVLPLALWWLLTLQPGPRRRQLLAWWSGLTFLAISWWLIPLVVLGRYSPPFLDWIESSEFTTSITDPVTVLRGADHWLAYLGSASVWRAGWMLATEPVFIVATGIVAAAGMAGLAMRCLPHRAFLVGGAVAGLVMVTAGHTGVMSGLGSEQIQTFLDETGAPLRNVHKFDLVLRIPLIVALAHFLTVVWPAAPRPRWRPIVTILVMGALVVTWLPALTGQLARDRTYVAMADYWTEASDWLNTKALPGRALIVPGASFAHYKWGRTQDEPLQALGGYPWGVRDAVPLSSAGNIRMLDAVEQRLQTGQGSPGLAEYLNRMGVRYLVVRNDLVAATGAPLPIRVHQGLDSSKGISRVQWFGPIVDSPDSTRVLSDEGLRVSYPAVEIYRVNASNEPTDPRVLLRPADTVIEVEGGPEALLALADVQGLGNRSTVLGGDPESGALTVARTVLTDTDRRREITFGYMRDNESATMTAEQRFQQSRPVHDYRVVGEEGTVVAAPGLRFAASSSAPDVGATRRQPRGATPAAAMDAALDTFWRPGRITERESFWEVRFDQPVTLPREIEAALLNRGTKTPSTLPLQTTTANGTVTADALDIAAWQSLPVAAGPTDFLRITSDGPVDNPRFGIREVRLPGTQPSRLILPTGTSGEALLLTARPGEASECAHQGDLIICSDRLGGFSQDRTGLFRQVELPQALSVDPVLLVAARDAQLIGESVDRIAGVGVETTSSRTTELAGSGIAAFDRRLGTAWQAAPDDRRPTLTIDLPQTRALRGIRLVNRDTLNASSPLEVQIGAGGRTFQGFTDNRGLFRFDPVATDQVTISVLTANQVRSRSGEGELTLPVGVSEIGLIGADDLRRPLPLDARVTLPCGAGPRIEVDGVTVSETEITARVEQFMDGDLVQATACTGPVSLPAGQHEVAVRSSDTFRPLVAAFAAEDLYGPTGRAQSPDVLRWEPAARVVSVPDEPSARILEVAENFNGGWQASVGERSLEPVRIDGWKQGFFVPPATEGLVTVEFSPDRMYRAGLLAGFLAVLAVLLVALRPPSIRVRPALRSRQWPQLLSAIVGLGVLLVLGPWGLLAFAAALVLSRRAPLPIVAFTAVTFAAILAAFGGVRPGSAVVVLQGCALAAAWAAIVWAGFGRATRTGSGSGSSPEPVAR